MPKVAVELPHELIKKVMEKYPGLAAEEAVGRLIMDSLKEGKQEISVFEAEVVGLHSVVTNLQRIVKSTSDTLNSYSRLLTDIRARLLDIMSMLDELNKRVTDLESRLAKYPPESPAEVRPHYARTEARETYHERERVRERKASAIEILKRQKVMFEADIASKIKNRDAFFERLRRDGAIVLELNDQRIAVDPEYWSEFLQKLETLDSYSDDKMREVLGVTGAELLKALYRDVKAYFDAIRKRWVVDLKELGLESEG